MGQICAYDSENEDVNTLYGVDVAMEALWTGTAFLSMASMKNIENLSLRMIEVPESESPLWDNLRLRLCL